jgi:hypothetical protein
MMRKWDTVMSYIGLALALIALLVAGWNSWGDTIDHYVLPVLISIAVLFFIICGVLIGLEDRFRSRRRIGRFIISAHQLNFGWITLFLGFFSLGIALLQYVGLLIGASFIFGATVVVYLLAFIKRGRVR